ncbi:hypothetical protein LXL04_012775 [Taraxacum kok-saghyz]
MNKSNGCRAAGRSPTTPETDTKGIKVKYISSPVMVEAKDASQFKKIVQHFTGQTPMERGFGIYSSPTTTTTTAAAVNTTTAGEATFGYYSYGLSDTKPQAVVDSCSWEEIAEWNRYR